MLTRGVREGAESEEGTSLTIREISALSGVSEGTLRMWETRYRFPTPHRLPSGHRRYSERELEQVRAVVRAREQGLSLPTAIEHARRLSQETRPSIYSALRESFPYLHAHLLPKRALLALSHAVEDEGCARAERPLLFGAFQHERFYRQAERRWRDMARTAERAIVLADFSRLRRPRHGPVEVPISESDPLMREWVVVCEGSGYAACVVGWERPRERNGGREYETVWTVEPSVVRAAARGCCELAARAVPTDLQDLRERLAGPAPSAGPELRAAVDLTTRMVLYATGARNGPAG
jgi:DICT domain-containing protein/predicted DNA-binding transcriptional regulator AlpA